MNRLELFNTYELMFHAFGYKLIDAKILIEYLCNNKCNVLNYEEVRTCYGGDPLRFHYLMFEFEQCGLIEILKRDTFGRIIEFSYKKNTVWTKDLL